MEFRKWFRKLTLALCLRTAAWVTIILAFALAGLALLLVFVSNQQWLNVLPICTMAFTAGGVLLTLAGHLFAQAREVGERNDKRSVFYLQACLTAYEEARLLLADGNNDRATWIAAGRALAHAKELSRQVTESAHIRVLELHRLKYRRSFAECLSGKTASFFYGSADESISTDEAAAASTAGCQRAGRAITSTVRALSPASVHEVWEAAQWPKPFDDPLTADFSKEEQGSLTVLFPGLHEYLEHRGEYRSGSGRLFRRNLSEN